MFRVIVAGGRNFNDVELLTRKLDLLLSDKRRELGWSGITIVTGMAKGADTLGRNYGLKKGMEIAEYPAQWDRYGKSAGYRRNEVMAANADALVAFWDGKSRGTKHMIDIATEQGLAVKIVRY